MRNFGGPELLIIVVMLGFAVLWVMGVARLFQKSYPALGWIANVGIIFPIIGLVGFAGWFVSDKSVMG